ncbi:hypothetical protein IEQ34_021657 [Dendrobium chrysotoxum]|uniref:SAM-dependent MTase RsmB/NOP-type domain-containing protein n=1 Tax=Dendrobium chrysotoxum TaxID=161865 RepID=A0AAV7G5C7_DENCH|nr:hypothetical protein IEQ34_021657 [Dendrobium chrysotoxum]
MVAIAKSGCHSVLSDPPPRISMASTVAKNREKSTARLIISGSTADRSAYFARREAARVLRCVLQGDARGRAAASIKSLIYSPSIRNKKATFALVCQTLKYLPVLKNVLAAANVLSAKWKKQATLIYVTAYDVLFGQKIGMIGAAEKLLMLHKDALESALSKLCTQKAVKCIEELLLDNQNYVLPKPRYVRVNTLKINAETAIQELERIAKVKIDDVVPDMLVLPGGTDLHDHRLVLDGSIFLQGKASSMVAVALRPKPGWKVLDACAAPGNKTSHLAALMKGKGKIIACEINKKRLMHLDDTIRRSGAHNVEIIHYDFLDINANDRSFSKVRAILLDPSCSGSGTSAERLDHLLPSYSAVPAVERVVYSTCSIHQTENEDVIKSVLPLATSLGFELATPFPQWSLRGRPVFDGAERLLRTDPSQDTEGFFIALFVKKLSSLPPAQKKLLLRQKKHFSPGRKLPFFPPKISKIWMRNCMARRRRGD